MRTRRFALPALFLLLFMGLLAPGAAAAAAGTTIRADYRATNKPGGLDDNRCSLIEAITEAQTPGTYSGGKTGLKNECRRAGSGQPVTIRLNSRRTYKLTTADNGLTGDLSGLPVITKPLTITGGKGTIVENDASSGESFRFFKVASGGKLTLVSIDFTSVSGLPAIPDDGGAILVQAGGTATLRNSILEHNRAAVRGGAVANFGLMTVEHASTIRFNQAVVSGGIGGAFYNAGMLDIGGEIDIRNNRSASDGGAIYNDTAGSLTFDDEAQLYGNHINTNGSRGAGIYNAGTATVDEAIISKNKGDVNTHPAIKGGGIYNDVGGTMSVRNTIFLYNLDNGIEIASPLTAFTGNCLYDGGTDGFSGGTSFKDDTGTNSNVDGNWWGIASGPSTITPASTPISSDSGDRPLGTANGDVPATFLRDPAPGCPLTTLDKNPSLEPSKPGGSTAPGWKKSLLVKNDRVDCAFAFLGHCSFKLTGTHADKTLSQTIHLSGPDEDYFGFMVSSKADNVPVGAVYRAKVSIFYNKDHSSENYEIAFSGGTHDWEHGAVYFPSTITSTHELFSSLKIVLEYNAPSGTVWFDDVRLIYCPYP